MLTGAWAAACCGGGPGAAGAGRPGTLLPRLPQRPHSQRRAWRSPPPAALACAARPGGPPCLPRAPAPSACAARPGRGPPDGRSARHAPPGAGWLHTQGPRHSTWRAGGLKLERALKLGASVARLVMAPDRRFKSAPAEGSNWSTRSPGCSPCTSPGPQRLCKASGKAATCAQGAVQARACRGRKPLRRGAGYSQWLRSLRSEWWLWPTLSAFRVCTSTSAAAHRAAHERRSAVTSQATRAEGSGALPARALIPHL